MKNVLFSGAALLWAASLASAQTTTATRKIAEGVIYRQEITIGASPLVVNILNADLNAPGVKIRTGLALDSISLTGAMKGREPLQNTALRNKALAAINADFFPFTSDPVGLAIRDGELISEPLEWRVCMSVTDAAVQFGVLAPAGVLMTGDGFALEALSGVNRVPHGSEIVCLTPVYAAAPALDSAATVMLIRKVSSPLRPSVTVRGEVESVTELRAGTPLPRCPVNSVLIVATGKVRDALPERFKAGDTAQFRFDLVMNGPAPTRGRYASRAGALRPAPVTPVWRDAQQAVSGGPWLVRDGKILVDGEAEDFSALEFVAKRYPRSAVGVTKDHHLLLVTVDGRQAQSVGMSLNELAKFMLNLGAVQAMNLDGGGSTTMFVDGGIVNGPSDGALRPIADSLLLYADDSKLPAGTEYHIAPTKENGVNVQVGDTANLRIEDANGKPPPPDVPIVWGTDRGLGWITQAGAFRSVRPGSAQITARVGAAQLKVPVSISSGAVSELTAKFAPLPNNPPDRSLLIVTAKDKFGNAVVGANLILKISGGEATDKPVTGADGTARIEIVWDALPENRKLTVRSGAAPAFTLKTEAK